MDEEQGEENVENHCVCLIDGGGKLNTVHAKSEEWFYREGGRVYQQTTKEILWTGWSHRSEALSAVKNNELTHGHHDNLA